MYTKGEVKGGAVAEIRPRAFETQRFGRGQKYVGPHEITSSLFQILLLLLLFALVSFFHKDRAQSNGLVFLPFNTLKE